MPHGMWNLSSLPGIEPLPLHWKHGILISGPPGKSPVIITILMTILLTIPQSSRQRACTPTGKSIALC